MSGGQSPTQSRFKLYQIAQGFVQSYSEHLQGRRFCIFRLLLQYLISLTVKKKKKNPKIKKPQFTNFWHRIFYSFTVKCSPASLAFICSCYLHLMTHILTREKLNSLLLFTIFMSFMTLWPVITTISLSKSSLSPRLKSLSLFGHSPYELL